MKKLIKSVGALLVLSALALGSAGAQVKLLNVSYDPTREFYVEYNAAFAKVCSVAQGPAYSLQGWGNFR